ncbi:MAG: Abi family protein [Dechloromonas agitata]|uniref:Abi family protein n=1 Tax=Dechloromonas agitata TaxID=73030 RepID=A0A930BQ82_9RHOO|nr:Abi family protein [Dechloromonas agitata]
MQNHLGQPRLAAVKRFFRTHSDDELLGCYAWCQAVAAGLLPILGDFEVAFRNALHLALSQYYGQQDSYDWMILSGNTAAAPAHHSLNTRSRRDISDMVGKIRGKKGPNYQINPNDVVAALSFGFWEVLIGNLDHRSHPNGLQASILANVFPHAPDLASCPYGDVGFKLRVTTLLARLRDARNRIGHHDAIWTVPEFDQQGAVGFIPRRPRNSVTSLCLLADRICWFAGWISPTIPAYIRTTDHWWSFQALLSQLALATYRRNGGRAGTYKALLDVLPLPTGGVHSIRQGDSDWFIDRLKQRQRLARDREYYF